MRIYLFLLSIFLCSISFAQKYEKYNAKDQLIADTSHLSKRQIKRLSSVQDTLIKQILANIRYPEVEMEAQIQGTAFISFTVNESDSLRDFKMLRAIPGGPGLGKEVLRVLKKVRLPIEKQAKTRKKDSIYCRLAFRFTLTGGVGSKGAFSNGTIVVTESGPGEPRALDPVIKRWMDSVKVFLGGQWAELNDFNEAKGDWSWNYIHNKLYTVTGNPNTDTFYVQRNIYPRGVFVGGSDYTPPTTINFQYYPVDKEIRSKDGSIYLLDSGPVYFYIDGFEGGWGVGNSVTRASLFTKNKVFYQGTNNAYVKSPVDTSKYYIFLNNLNRNDLTYLACFIVGEKKRVFKKDTLHKDGGILVACEPLFKKNDWIYYNSTDSEVYVLFAPDSQKVLNKGDTVLLRVKFAELYDAKKKKSLKYVIECQYYPFQLRQVKDVMKFYQSYRIDYIEMYTVGHPSFFYKLFHKNAYRDPKELDPVFKYMKKKKLYAKN